MFALNESGEAYIFLGDPAAVELTVPALHRGKPVTAIGGNAFWKNKNLKRVTLPDSITEIGANAFADCTALEGVTLGGGLTDIGQRAFAGCTALQWVSVPTASAWLSIRFESAASNPFSYADELRVGGTAVTALSVPAGVTEIGDFAFYNMSFLQSVQLPDSVTRIGTRAFAACSRMTTCNMPAALTEIGAEAFYFCRSLSALTLPATVERIGVGAFLRCTSLTAATLTVTEGWSYGETPMEPAELADAATAARYLTDSHTEEVWTRAAS
ncbi:MAG: leucine-rich repeat protein [Clostridia bacterium]|nr:leucine-rich repeat protein [Clostridia bacterium]